MSMENLVRCIIRALCVDMLQKPTGIATCPRNASMDEHSQLPISNDNLVDKI
ncbi:MAG: hypothetical protein ABFD82_23845 [Syntrophaceae bacterium]